jgi:hypothetical protein
MLQKDNTAQRYFGLTFEGSIVDMKVLYYRYNIVDLDAEVCIETSVNETFSLVVMFIDFEKATYLKKKNPKFDCLFRKYELYLLITL